MTVYVDDFRAQARVGRTSGRWSHLTADTVEELHEFAAAIGLKPEWFQPRCRYARCDPCPHWHFDVTDSKRQAAIRAGAVPVSMREFGELISARRRSMRQTGGR